MRNCNQQPMQPANCEPNDSNAAPAVSGWRGRFAALLHSFRFRLFTLILLIIVPGLGTSIYGNFEQRRIEKNRVFEGALAISRLAASNQEHFIDHARQI